MSKLVQKKILPEYFLAVCEDRKKFELRKDEDNIQPGDILLLQEWDSERGYTGAARARKVQYVLRSVPEYGLMEGYCIIGW